MNKSKTYKMVANTLGSIQRLNQLGEREFARVFYGYIREKFNRYCEEGFLSAYNRLDISNCIRVLDYITEEVNEANYGD